MKLPRWAYVTGWIIIAVAASILEGMAVKDKRKGDTLSEQIWRILDIHPVVWFMGAGGLVWMVRHFLFKKG